MWGDEHVDEHVDGLTEPHTALYIQISNWDHHWDEPRIEKVLGA